MKFDLVAVVAQESSLVSAMLGLPRVLPVPLGQGWSLLPVTRAVHVASASAHAAAVPGLSHLRQGLAQRLAEASHAGPIAYVEADFRGGIGGQGSVVWENGAVTLGPLRCNHSEGRVPVITEWPINRALRHLGVIATPGRDEFDTLRLGRFGTTEAWADPAEHDRGRRWSSVA
jgi:hypothetical protein